MKHWGLGGGETGADHYQNLFFPKGKYLYYCPYLSSLVGAGERWGEVRGVFWGEIRGEGFPLLSLKKYFFSLKIKQNARTTFWNEINMQKEFVTFLLGYHHPFQVFQVSKTYIFIHVIKLFPSLFINISLKLVLRHGWQYRPWLRFKLWAEAYRSNLGLLTDWLTHNALRNLAKVEKSYSGQTLARYQSASHLANAPWRQ